jgi:hypothetical protein
MVQAALLKVERNSKNQIRHHHDYWERAELIRAEPEWSEGLTARYRTRFSANQHRRSGKVRDTSLYFFQQCHRFAATNAIAFPILGPPRRVWCCPSIRSQQ